MIKFILLLLFTTHSLIAIAQEFNLDRIQPYRQNPWFWQYQGEPMILDLRELPQTYKVEWLNVEGAKWFHQITLKGGGIVELKAPFMGNWIALLLQVRSN